MTALGLYRLLTPYFLSGVTFPHEADAYLSQLGVADLAASYDDNAVIYTGSMLVLLVIALRFVRT